MKVRDLLNDMLVMTLLVITIILSVMIVRTVAAPAPLERCDRAASKQQQHFIVGHWILSYGGTDYKAEFRKDGTYTASKEGITWNGTWKWNPDTRSLWVYEGHDGKPPWLEWSALLDCYLNDNSSRCIRLRKGQ